MRIGTNRHISDIRADDMTQEGQGYINLQSGSNQGANQAGMSFGAGRQIVSGVEDLAEQYYDGSTDGYSDY
jgi:hypothetical protein